MKTITLQILAEDIRNSFYTNARKCAITLAIDRAGLNDIRETGGNITKGSIFGGDEIITPKNLSNKVVSMYKFVGKEPFNDDIQSLEPQDFTFELEVPDNW